VPNAAALVALPESMRRCRRLQHFWSAHCSARATQSFLCQLRYSCAIAFDCCLVIVIGTEHVFTRASTVAATQLTSSEVLCMYSQSKWTVSVSRNECDDVSAHSQKENIPHFARVTMALVRGL